MKAINLLHHKKGQAAVELAVFGGLIIFGFSIILMYGQRFDAQQQVKMEAFRRALERAYNVNGSVSYTYKKDMRSANLFSAFGQGQPSTMSASANVMWQKGTSGPLEGKDSDKQQSFSYYVVNDQNMLDTDGTGLPRYPKETRDYSGGKNDTWVPLSIYKEEQTREEGYTSIVGKEEKSRTIKNSRDTSLKDKITIKLHTRYDNSHDNDLWDDKYPLPNYFYEGEPYYYNKPHTIASIPKRSYGAYYNKDKNRIEYNSKHSDNSIWQQRTWRTKN